MEESSCSVPFLELSCKQSGNNRFLNFLSRAKKGFCSRSIPDHVFAWRRNIKYRQRSRGLLPSADRASYPRIFYIPAAGSWTGQRILEWPTDGRNYLLLLLVRYDTCLGGVIQRCSSHAGSERTYEISLHLCPCFHIHDYVVIFIVNLNYPCDSWILDLSWSQHVLD